MRRRILRALVVAALSTASVNGIHAAGPTKQISLPPLSQEVTVFVGDDMLRQGTVTTVEGLNLTAPVELRDLMGNRFTVSSGFFPITREDESYIFTSFTPNSSGTASGFGGISGRGSERISALRFSKGAKQVCYVYQGSRCSKSPVEYARDAREIENANSFQQTLIYNGKTGSVIKIGYREFVGGLARPAFSNEVEYDLKESSEIGYKGSRLRVLDASGSRIRYVVIANFNTQR